MSEKSFTSIDELTKFWSTSCNHEPRHLRDNLCPIISDVGPTLIRNIQSRAISKEDGLRFLAICSDIMQDLTSLIRDKIAFPEDIFDNTGIVDLNAGIHPTDDAWFEVNLVGTRQDRVDGGALACTCMGLIFGWSILLQVNKDPSIMASIDISIQWDTLAKRGSTLYRAWKWAHPGQIMMPHFGELLAMPELEIFRSTTRVMEFNGFFATHPTNSTRDSDDSIMPMISIDSVLLRAKAISLRERRPVAIVATIGAHSLTIIAVAYVSSPVYWLIDSHGVPAHEGMSCVRASDTRGIVEFLQTGSYDFLNGKEYSAVLFTYFPQSTIVQAPLPDRGPIRKRKSEDLHREDRHPLKRRNH